MVYNVMFAIIQNMGIVTHEAVRPNADLLVSRNGRAIINERVITNQYATTLFGRKLDWNHCAEQRNTFTKNQFPRAGDTNAAL